MNSDLLARWTVIITNIAIVVGLVFVGLEFRNNARSSEAERVDSYTQGVIEMNITVMENKELADIFYQAYADPDSLSGSDLDRVQHGMLVMYNNFNRVYLAHKSGLVSDELYEIQKQSVGFGLSSNVGLDLIKIMRASGLGDEAWKIISESAKQARAYCDNPQNACVARYEAGRGTS